MNDLYSFENMIEQRRRDVEAGLRHQRELNAARQIEDRTARMHRTLNELTQMRRIVKLGRVVIMW